VRYSEWLSLGFFVWIAAAGFRRGLSPSRRWQVIAGGAVMSAAVLWGAGMGQADVRDWLPALYILIGYFLSGRLFVAPSLGVERWLADWDRRVLGDPPARYFARWPTPLLVFLDLIYIFCFLLVPGGFAVLWWTGHQALADRYWTMVAATEFLAFAPLALMQTRPPWALEARVEHRHDPIYRLAAVFVRRATIGANTFPSGHVAASLAVGIAVAAAEPAAGAALTGLGLGIAVACASGRYHYVVDIAAGLVLALAMWGVVALLGV
jgi:hypothetical protein